VSVAEFGIVDLTVAAVEPGNGVANGAQGQSAGGWLGSVDTAVVASALESLREDLTAHIQSSPGGLRLSTLTIRLSLSAEGKVAFVAKGSAEACIEVVFSVPDQAGG
jgi:hypothetical protein